MTKITPVIISGGSGTRLWPLSRPSHPKQFLPLTKGTDTLLQKTLLRLDGFIDISSPIIVSNEQHRFLTANQLLEIGIKSPQIIIESQGRNTAPAIALAAFQAQKNKPKSLLLVLPADHEIESTNEFQKAISTAFDTAVEGRIVTFGVRPTQAETGYGYIKVNPNNELVKEVDQFVEKPSYTAAKAYLDSGEYFWNSGMVLMRADIYLSELKKHEAEIYFNCQKAMDLADENPDLSVPKKRPLKHLLQNQLTMRFWKFLRKYR